MVLRIVIHLLVAAFVLPVALTGCTDSHTSSSQSTRLEVSRTLGAEEQSGYARALEPRTFEFPRDHGPHPDFKTEWWYYTGNLADASDRIFGYQLTFFRIALAPRPIPRQSDWGTRQVYMAHFAVTDAGERRFFHDERFARGALGLAGAQYAPFHVWLEGWQAQGTEAVFPMRLQAATEKTAINLTLEQGKPVVLQGDQGLSRKSEQAGNASYYYSLTRMPTSGHIEIEGERYEVRGHSWLDREWSTSALAPDQEGWDWFALQLDDGHELMYYQLRRRDGSPDPASRGVLVFPDGSARPLENKELQLQVTDYWESPRGGRYPSAWQLDIPARSLQLRIEPLLADQEMDVTVRYWEGAVRISGDHSGDPVKGRGYVELTGYADRVP